MRVLSLIGSFVSFSYWSTAKTHCAMTSSNGRSGGNVGVKRPTSMALCLPPAFGLYSLRMSLHAMSPLCCSEVLTILRAFPFTDCTSMYHSALLCLMTSSSPSSTSVTSRSVAAFTAMFIASSRSSNPATESRTVCHSWKSSSLPLNIGSFSKTLGSIMDDSSLEERAR